MANVFERLREGVYRDLWLSSYDFTILVFFLLFIMALKYIGISIVQGPDMQPLEQPNLPCRLFKYKGTSLLANWSFDIVFWDFDIVLYLSLSNSGILTVEIFEVRRLF